MSLGTAGRPPGDSPSAPDRAFHFRGCSEIRDSLGLRADGERRLLSDPEERQSMGRLAREHARRNTRHLADYLQMMRLHAGA